MVEVRQEMRQAVQAISDGPGQRGLAGKLVQLVALGRRRSSPPSPSRNSLSYCRIAFALSNEDIYPLY